MQDTNLSMVSAVLLEDSVALLAQTPPAAGVGVAAVSRHGIDRVVHERGGWSTKASEWGVPAVDLVTWRAGAHRGFRGCCV